MKRSSVFVFAALAAAFLLQSCNRFYKSPEFAEKTRDHKTVAILPYEIVITGRLPKDLTEENRQKLEEAESRAFQRNLYDQIHIVGARGKRELSVTVQPVDKTNSILRDSGIDIRQSWTQDPQKLAQMLGVDAVIKPKAIKQRFLSDLESIGVQLGSAVLNVLLGGPFVAGFGARTNTVDVSIGILAASDGSNLFSGRDEIEVDWSRPANEAIEQINRRVARRWPYRK